MGLWLALFCALFVGTGDVLSKLALQKSHERIVGFSRLLFSLPILGVVVWTKGIPPLTRPFWLTLLVMIPFELSAYLLYLRALRIAPLSLTIPFLAFTPVFTIVTSWILLGEQVSMGGAVGILAVTFGAYLLHLDTVSKGWAAPLRALFRERGSRLMIFAAFFYSITSNLGKRAIQLSDPFSFAFLYHLINATLLLGLIWYTRRGIGRLGKEMFSQWKIYLLLGPVIAFGFLAHCVGIAQVPVPYFISIKRTSLLVGVLVGGFLLKEQNLSQRLMAVSFMILGVGLIVLFR